jgi:hypothetical protein
MVARPAPIVLRRGLFTPLSVCVLCTVTCKQAGCGCAHEDGTFGIFDFEMKPSSRTGSAMGGLREEIHSVKKHHVRFPGNGTPLGLLGGPLRGALDRLKPNETGPCRSQGRNAVCRRPERRPLESRAAFNVFSTEHSLRSSDRVTTNLESWRGTCLQDLLENIRVPCPPLPRWGPACFLVFAIAWPDPSGPLYVLRTGPQPARPMDQLFLVLYLPAAAKCERPTRANPSP